MDTMTPPVEGHGPEVWSRGPGGWQACDAGVPPAAARARGEAVWVRATGRDELVAAAAALGLPPDVVARAGSKGPHHRPGRPHVERVPHGCYVLAPTVSYVEEGAKVLSGTVECLALDGVVLTVEHGPTHVLDEVARRLVDPPPVDDALTAGFLPTLLACLVGTVADVEDELGHDVEELEAHVFSAERTRPVEAIYALKREITEARHGLQPLSAELPDLVSATDEDEAGQAWLSRLGTVVDRLDRRLEAHDRLLTDLLSAHLALVSLRQNDDVRRISAWAAMAAVPTLIASVYGMNFVHMPELAWRWGYAGVLVAMVLVSVGLHRLFTRSGWL